jgi:hypothetical protein
MYLSVLKTSPCATSAGLSLEYRLGAQALAMRAICGQINHFIHIQSFYLPLLRKIWPVMTLLFNNIYIEGP